MGSHGEGDDARIARSGMGLGPVRPGSSGDRGLRRRSRVALDVEYIERQSFLLDLYIILMTLPCLLGDRENIR